MKGRKTLSAIGGPPLLGETPTAQTRRAGTRPGGQHAGGWAPRALPRPAPFAHMVEGAKSSVVSVLGLRASVLAWRRWDLRVTRSALTELQPSDPFLPVLGLPCPSEQ